VQVSPDGKRIVFAAGKRADFDQLRESRIWIVPSDGSEVARMLHESRSDQSMPRWSPDGRSIAFLSGGSSGVQEEKTKQIWLLHLDSGALNPLTVLKSGVDNFQWSPDGKFIAFTTTDPLTEEEERKAKEKDDAIHVDHNYKFSRLWSLNPVDRTVRRIFHQDANVNDFDWSPDSSRLAIKISNTPLLDDVFWRSRLVIVRLQTGEIVRTIDEQAGSWIKIRWSPDGNSVAFSRVSANGVAEWRMIAPIQGGVARQIDNDYNGTILGMDWLPDSRSLLAMSIEGTRAKLMKIDAIGGGIDSLVELQAPYADFTISGDGRTVAFVAEQSNSPANVWVWKMDESPRQLTNFQPEVGSWNVGSVREITWRNKKDNALLYGVLITPPGFQQNRRPARTIVQVHGGPEWAWWSGWHGSWHEWGQLLASNGYVVFLPNPRGSDGQNWRFVEANIDDWGGMDYEDILSGIDYLIAENITDPDRIGIGGWSYGGFMTAWAVTHTDRFKAAVVGAAVTNLFSMSGTGDIPTFLNHYFKDTPFKRRSTYDSHSPMTYLQNCKTPSLVVHGEADLRVPLSQGSEFYNGLKMLGGQTEMVIYPREAHGFTEQLHQQDLLRRVLAWYDRYLPTPD
jgi:dipeptidyl aminopeptidase/acylaminoacyl peptidase